MADESGNGTGARSGTGDSSSTAAATVATAPTVWVAGVIGIVAPFNGKVEWIGHAERLEHYFIANDITDVTKKSNFAQCSRSVYLSFDQNPGYPKTSCLNRLLRRSQLTTTPNRRNALNSIREFKRKGSP